MPKFEFSRRGKDELYGKKADIKTFYENTVDTENGPRWVEWAPPTVPRTKQTKWEGFAIQVYKKLRDTWDPRREQSFQISHIRLLSPFLRTELEPLLGPHGLRFGDDFTEIQAPLKELYYERHAIQGLWEKSEEPAKDHFRVLLKIMQEELGPILEEVEDLEKESQITHSLLWTLFPKGTIVIRSLENSMIPQGFMTTHSARSTDESQDFTIRCTMIRFDGIYYGTREQYWRIPFFMGKRDITSLPLFPLQWLKGEKERVRQEMIDRGKRVLEFQDMHYVKYLNVPSKSSDKETEGNQSFGNIWNKKGEMRIMIDFQLSRERKHTFEVVPLSSYLPNTSKVKAFKRPRRVYRRRSRDAQTRTRNYISSDSYSDDDDDYNERMGLVRKSVPQTERNTLRRLTEDEKERNKKMVLEKEDNLLLLDPHLDGFSLASKQWQSFNVERVDSLDLNSDAFDFLVHSKQSKNFVCSIVDDHAIHASSVSDIVAGKGEGLLILLSGSPGTGKTLMAEAIADKTQKPLYFVDSRDLGRAAKIESSISEVMADAAAWNAILLLDEADVYLQRRSIDSLERNEIVAVFLRLLEYYRGIMFLTTNLWDSIDDAVQSRIQIHLRFHDLNHASRSQIWSNFLKRLDEKVCQVDAKDVEEIGKWRMNGRQIRNVVRMAEAWNRQVKTKINLEMIEQIIPITCPKAEKEDEKDEAKNNGTKVTKNSRDDLLLL